MLRRSLEGLVRPEAFAATGIRATARAEELSLADWEQLAAWEPDEGSAAREGSDPVGRGDR
jgi:hypothetical protein